MSSSNTTGSGAMGSFDYQFVNEPPRSRPRQPQLRLQAQPEVDTKGNRCGMCCAKIPANEMYLVIDAIFLDYENVREYRQLKKICCPCLERLVYKSRRRKTGSIFDELSEVKDERNT